MRTSLWRRWGDLAMNIPIDIQYTLRSLAKDKQFTALVVLVISIGLGLTIYAYTLIASMIKGDLPFHEGSAIVSINGAYNGGKAGLHSIDGRDFYEMRQEITTLLDDLGAYAFNDQIVTYGELTRMYRTTYTEWNMFRLTHTEPMLGRAFRPEDNHLASERIAILSYDVWQRDFGGRADIVDKTVEVSATPTRIVGVMPEGYAMPMNTQIWLPIHEQWLQPDARASGWAVGGYGRLKDGVSLSELNKQLLQISKRYQQLYPYTNGNHGLYYYATSFPESLWVSNDMKGLLDSLYVITAIIFLLACVNVATLLLSKINSKRREIAIRVALGAPRNKIASIVLMECLSLCLVGCAIGIILAIIGLGLTENFLRVYLYDNSPPFWLDLSINSDVLLGLPVVLTVTLLLISSMPIIRAVNSDSNAELRDGTRGAQGKRAGMLANLLVISQILLSIVALILAVLMSVSNHLNSQKDYGADIDNVVTATIQLPEAAYPDLESVARFYEQFTQMLNANPNIDSTAIVSRLPGDFPIDGSIRQAYEVEGVQYLKDDDRLEGVRVYSQPGSLPAMGVELLSGRFFDSRDSMDGARTVILTETLAKRLWPDESALGKRVRLGRWGRMEWMTEEHTPWMTVVGITRDVYNNDPYGLMNYDNGSAYIPLTQRTIWSSHIMEIAVRYQGDIRSAMTTIDNTRKSIDRGVAIYGVSSFERRINQNGNMYEAIGDLFLLCGIIALFLAIVGNYGVIANTIIQRTQEIGIRRAVGAGDGAILIFFLRKSLLNLYVAIPVGVVSAIYVVRFVTTRINIHADGIYFSFAIVPVIVCLVTLIATYAPTRKAIALHPSDALRHD